MDDDYLLHKGGSASAQVNGDEYPISGNFTARLFLTIKPGPKAMVSVTCTINT